MKKIMFNDRYGLTKAVLDGKKTMTRRIIPIDLYNQTDWKAVAEGDFEAVVDGEGDYHDIRQCGMYHVGEVVAVAQSYHALNKSGFIAPEWCEHTCESSAGYENKMFVRADLMPHSIIIRKVDVQRLQSISDEDCMKEGIMEGEFMNTWDTFYFDEWGDVANHITFKRPRDAYRNLIDRISGKGTWQRNPWVYVYEFELLR
jgi:hypothetical protein